MKMQPKNQFGNLNSIHHQDDGKIESIKKLIELEIANILSNQGLKKNDTIKLYGDEYIFDGKNIYKILEKNEYGYKVSNLNGLTGYLNQNLEIIGGGIIYKFCSLALVNSKADKNILEFVIINIDSEGPTQIINDNGKILFSIEKGFFEGIKYTNGKAFFFINNNNSRYIMDSEGNKYFDFIKGPNSNEIFEAKGKLYCIVHDFEKGEFAIFDIYGNNILGRKTSIELILNGGTENPIFFVNEYNRNKRQKYFYDIDNNIIFGGHNWREVYSLKNTTKKYTKNNDGNYEESEYGELIICYGDSFGNDAEHRFNEIYGRTIELDQYGNEYYIERVDYSNIDLTTIKEYYLLQGGMKIAIPVKQ